MIRQETEIEYGSPLSDLARLIAPGILGFYTHVEATEVFATQDGRSDAINVLQS